MKTRLIFALVLTLTGVVCAQQSANSPGAAEQEIAALEKTFNALYAANDLQPYFAFYAQDLTQFLPQGRTDLRTYEKEWTDYIAGGNRLEAAELSDLHVQVGPSRDTAVASYLLHVKSRSAKGEVSDEYFQESDVFFKREGAWKIVHLHYSPAPKRK